MYQSLPGKYTLHVLNEEDNGGAMETTTGFGGCKVPGEPNGKEAGQI